MTEWNVGLGGGAATERDAGLGGCAGPVMTSKANPSCRDGFRRELPLQ